MLHENYLLIKCIKIIDLFRMIAINFKKYIQVLLIRWVAKEMK